MKDLQCVYIAYLFCVYFITSSKEKMDIINKVDLFNKMK